MVALAISAPSASAGPLTGNLVVNPGAESDSGATDASSTDAPEGWELWHQSGGLETFSSVRYGLGDGFPSTALSSAIGGGNNFFAGGPCDAVSDPCSGGAQYAEQQVDVSAYTAAIDAGNVTAELSADLGGRGSDIDRMNVRAYAWDDEGDGDGTFLGASPWLLSTTPEERGDQTTMLHRSTSWTVPVGTRTIGVELHAILDEYPYNDGYADNICLALSSPSGSGGAGCSGEDGNGYIEAPFTQMEPGSADGVMPNVLGKDVDEARDAVSEAFDNAQFELDFQKACKPKKTLEVIQQSPAGSQEVEGSLGKPILVKLGVCLGDRAFLDDCEKAALADDLEPLGGTLDGNLALTVAAKLADCKADYDVNITNGVDEAAQLSAQGTKRNGEIRVALDCPSESDLISSVGESWSSTTGLTFGLRVNGDEDELWTLPAPLGGRGTQNYKSFVSVTVKDRAGQWPAATAVVDDDQINPFNKKVDLYKSRDGVITIPVAAVKPGTLRICVYQKTASAELLTKSIEIEVIEGPAGGSNEIYETAGGRYIKFADDGPVEITPEQAGVGKRDFFGCLADIWGCVSSLFNGRSQTMNDLESETSMSSKKKYASARKQAKLGIAQIAMGPELQSDPGSPEVVTQDCLVVWQDTYYAAQCPVITAPGGAVIVGANNGGGGGIVAAGGGNILSHNGGQIVAAGAGNLVGSDGGSLVGSDGGSLVGSDGGSLVAAGGLNSANGIVAAGGLNAIQPDTAGIVAAGGLNLVGSDGATIVAAGAGNLIGNSSNTLVAPGSLP